MSGVPGFIIGPVLGPGAIEGVGTFETIPAGLRWTIKKRLKRLAGLVAWDRITKWQAGLQTLGRDQAWVVLVTYDNDPPGLLGFHSPSSVPFQVEMLSMQAWRYLDHQRFETTFDTRNWDRYGEDPPLPLL